MENLLTISRADAGQYHLQRNPVSILDLTRESAAMLDVLIDEKSQHLHLEGDAGAIVVGDRLILRQAIVNVLHNAIKFSPPEGDISVSVKENGRNVKIRISDSGPGIDEEHHGMVFQRFYRADKARSSETGGAGLGLAIAQWAVEAHGGRITLESVLGSGSTFQLEIPREVQ